MSAPPHISTERATGPGQPCSVWVEAPQFSSLSSHSSVLSPAISRTDPVLNSCSERKRELGKRTTTSPIPSIHFATPSHRHVVPISIPRSQSRSSSADRCPGCRAQLRCRRDPGWQAPDRCLRPRWHLRLCSGTMTDPLQFRLCSWSGAACRPGRWSIGSTTMHRDGLGCRLFLPSVGLTHELFSTLLPPSPPLSTLPPRPSAP